MLDRVEAVGAESIGEGVGLSGRDADRLATLKGVYVPAQQCAMV